VPRTGQFRHHHEWEYPRWALALLQFHLQGGGWCTSASDCYSRSQTILGSSKTWSPWLSTQWPPEGAAFYGLMDANATNPFGNWTFVWAAYCDGSSMTSDADAPVVYNGTNLYMRGRAILDAHLDELEAAFGFMSTVSDGQRMAGGATTGAVTAAGATRILPLHQACIPPSIGTLDARALQASEVIISGTSAGGLATYLHTSYIKSRLPPAARVVAMPDAGFFLSHVSYTSGTYAWYDTIASAVQPALWNATLRGAGARCLADLAPKGLGPRCYFAQYIYPYLTDVDGVFILQSLYGACRRGRAGRGVEAYVFVCIRVRVMVLQRMASLAHCCPTAAHSHCRPCRRPPADSAQLAICYNFYCNPFTSCSTAEVQAMQGYSRDLVSNITAVVAPFATRDGYFLTSCFQHEESCRARDWYGITINGQTANSTLYAWYTAGVNADATRIDVDWPGDGSCAPQGFDHGAC